MDEITLYLSEEFSRLFSKKLRTGNFTFGVFPASPSKSDHLALYRKDPAQKAKNMKLL